MVSAWVVAAFLRGFVSVLMWPTVLSSPSSLTMISAWVRLRRLSRTCLPSLSRAIGFIGLLLGLWPVRVTSQQGCRSERTDAEDGENDQLQWTGLMKSHDGLSEFGAGAQRPGEQDQPDPAEGDLSEHGDGARQCCRGQGADDEGCEHGNGVEGEHKQRFTATGVSQVLDERVVPRHHRQPGRQGQADVEDDGHPLRVAVVEAGSPAPRLVSRASSMMICLPRRGSSSMTTMSYPPARWNGAVPALTRQDRGPLRR